MPAFIAIILFMTAIPAKAEPVADGVVLADMYGEILRTLVPTPSGDSLRSASVSFEGPILPSASVRTRTEAILTGRGYTIAEPGGGYGISIIIAITEARVAVRREKEGLGRYYALNVHARGTGLNGVTLFARGDMATRSDAIPSRSIRSTDTARDFSQSIVRIDAGGKPGRLTIISFLVFTSALGWFAFR